MKKMIYLSIIACLLIQIPIINSSISLILTQYDNLLYDPNIVDVEGLYSFDKDFIPWIETFSPLPIYAAFCDYTMIEPNYYGMWALLPGFNVNNLKIDHNNQCKFYQVVQQKSVCESSSPVVPDEWCQTFCIFNESGSCTSVALHMTSICECNNVSRNVKIPSQCLSLNAAVPHSWCSTYCHFSNNICTVDQHMRSICACSNP